MYDGDNVIIISPHDKGKDYNLDFGKLFKPEDILFLLFKVYSEQIYLNDHFSLRITDDVIHLLLKNHKEYINEYMKNLELNIVVEELDPINEMSVRILIEEYFIVLINYIRDEYIVDSKELDKFFKNISKNLRRRKVRSYGRLYDALSKDGTFNVNKLTGNDILKLIDEHHAIFLFKNNKDELHIKFIKPNTKHIIEYNINN